MRLLVSQRGAELHKTIRHFYQSYCMIIITFLPLMDCSEENKSEPALNGTGNIPISLVEYLTTKYDKTVRPNATSGDYSVTKSLDYENTFYLIMNLISYSKSHI